MPLGKLDSKSVEEKWAKVWREEGAHAFDAGSGKLFYVIDTPPPFPTGEFHMGGVLNWCYIDFVARYKRLRGFEVLFPQGWDCHGFPTEVKVEEKYGRLPRNEFVEKCVEWTRDVISTMRPQMNQMGFSIDWAREYYTIAPEYHEAVQRIEDGRHKPGTIVWVLAKGYLFAGKLLRPAMVGVAVDPPEYTESRMGPNGGEGAGS